MTKYVQLHYWLVIELILSYLTGYSLHKLGIFCTLYGLFYEHYSAVWYHFKVSLRWSIVSWGSLSVSISMYRRRHIGHYSLGLVMKDILNYVELIIHLCLFLLKLPLYHHYSCGLYCDFIGHYWHEYLLH